MSNRSSQAVEFLRKLVADARHGASSATTAQWEANPDRGVAAVWRKALQGEPLDSDEELVLETVVLPGLRPSLEVVGNDYGPVGGAAWPILNDPEVRARLARVVKSVGRIDIVGHPGLSFSGAGIVVGDGLVMTNRHIADLFGAGLGDGGLGFQAGRGSTIDFADGGEALPVAAVAMIHPHWDIALLRVDGLTDAHPPLELHAAVEGEFAGRPIAVVGFPGFDARVAANVQTRVFNGRFGVKRLSPGFGIGRRDVASFGGQVSAFAHDASTLGANSGAAVVDLETGHVVGLQFTSRYLDANFSVPSWEMARDPRIVAAGVRFSSPPAPDPAVGHAWWAALAGAAVAGLGGAALLAASSRAAPAAHLAPGPDAGKGPDGKPATGPVSGKTSEAALTALSGDWEKAAGHVLGDGALSAVARAAIKNNAITGVAKSAFAEVTHALGPSVSGGLPNPASGGEHAAPGIAAAAMGALGLSPHAPDGSARLTLGIPIPDGPPLAIPIHLNLRLNVVGADGAGAASVARSLPGGHVGAALAGSPNEIPVNLNFRFQHDINHTGEVSHAGAVNHTQGLGNLGNSGGSGSRRLISDLAGAGLGAGVGAGLGSSIGPSAAYLRSLAGGGGSGGSGSSPGSSSTASYAPSSSTGSPSGGGSSGGATAPSSSPTASVAKAAPASPDTSAQDQGTSPPGAAPTAGDPQLPADAPLPQGVEHGHSGPSLASTPNNPPPPAINPPDGAPALSVAPSSTPNLFVFPDPGVHTPQAGALSGPPGPSPLDWTLFDRHVDPPPTGPASPKAHDQQPGGFNPFNDLPDWKHPLSGGVPEPSTWIMLLAGFGAVAGLGLLRRARRRARGPGSARQ